MKRTVHPINRDGKHRTAECPYCGTRLNSNKFKEHLATHESKKECKYCKKNFRSDKLSKHELLCQSSVDESLCNRHGGVHEHLDSEDCSSSISGFFKSYKLNIDESSDYDKILSNACKEAKSKLEVFLQRHPVKAQIIINLSFYKERLGEREISDKTFRSLCEPLLAGDNLEDFLSRAKVYIKRGIEEYTRLGSG